MLKKISILMIAVALGLTVFSACQKAPQTLPAPPEATVQSTQASSPTESVKATSSANPTTTPEPAVSYSAMPSEDPLQPEKNPPGDIPDSQVFIDYSSSAGGYHLQVPEGWARTENGTDVTFVDKFDGIKVEMSGSSLPLSADNIKANQAIELQNTERAVQINSIKEVSLKGGTAVIVAYDSNSEPDSVTNKQIRQENEKIYFLNNGKLAAITLWAPKGADNVDQWNLISNSFTWGK